MDYVDILSTGLYWYAIGGVAILIGSLIIYAIALLIYGLLARLGMLISRLLSYIAGRVDVSLRHHPFA
jgi:hypothetical protein